MLGVAVGVGVRVGDGVGGLVVRVEQPKVVGGIAAVVVVTAAGVDDGGVVVDDNDGGSTTRDCDGINGDEPRTSLKGEAERELCCSAEVVVVVVVIELITVIVADGNVPNVGVAKPNGLVSAEIPEDCC